VPLSSLKGAAPILKGAAALEGVLAGCQGYLLCETPLICCCLFPTVFDCELGFLVVGVFGFPLVLTVVA